MQKIKSLLTFVLILFAMTARADVLPGTPQKSTNAQFKEDINEDGTVDVEDIKALSDAILTANNATHFDFSNDRQVTVADLVAFIDYVASLTADNSNLPTIDPEPWNGEANSQKRQK